MGFAWPLLGIPDPCEKGQVEMPAPESAALTAWHRDKAVLQNAMKAVGKSNPEHADEGGGGGRSDNSANLMRKIIKEELQRKGAHSKKGDQKGDNK